MLLAASPARAQGTLERAAETLRLDPVYVDPDAERAISDSDADELRELIADEDAGPTEEAGVYAGVIGDSFRAGATEGVLPQGQAGELARAAFVAERARGTTAVLEDFVRRVGKARSGGGGGGGGDGGGGGGLGWLWPPGLW